MILSCCLASVSLLAALHFLHPILNHPNFHGTPHIGAATHEAQHRIGVEMAHLLITYFDGNTPKSVVNRDVLS